MSTRTKKSSVKKYRLSDLLRAIRRNLLVFLSAIIIGANVGAALYFLVPQPKYVSACNISFIGSNLDKYQQSRICDLVTSNESVDKYVNSLAASNVKNGNALFTFSDIGPNITCSVLSLSNDNKMHIIFEIRFSFGNPDVGIPVLKVISNRAVKELNTIYTKDSFGVDYNSFVNESVYKTRDISLLMLPIALSFILGVIGVIIIDLRTDLVFDVGDCEEVFCNTIVIKPDKEDRYIFDGILGNTLISCGSDIERLKNILGNNLTKDTEICSFEEQNSKKTRKNSKQKQLVVVLGVTKYSEFLNAINTMKASNTIEEYNAVCIVHKKGKVKSDCSKDSKKQ